MDDQIVLVEHVDDWIVPLVEHVHDRIVEHVDDRIVQHVDDWIVQQLD